MYILMIYLYINMIYIIISFWTTDKILKYFLIIKTDFFSTSVDSFM